MMILANGQRKALSSLSSLFFAAFLDRDAATRVARLTRSLARAEPKIGRDLSSSSSPSSPFSHAQTANRRAAVGSLMPGS